jgi:prevent-host-death family protein
MDGHWGEPLLNPMQEPSRTVNVHDAKTHFSRLIDAAHAGETIVVAKGGRPWARLMPLEAPISRRQPGVLAGRINLPAIEVLLEPLPEDELAGLEQPLL